MNKGGVKTKKFLLVTFLLLVSFFWNRKITPVFAVECEDYVCATIENDDEMTACLNKQIVCLKNSIEKNQKEQNTLKNAIAGNEYRLKLKNAEVEKTKVDIIIAKREIEILSARIENLSLSMEKMAGLLTQLVASSYKAEHISDLEMYLKTTNFNEALQRKQQQEIVSIQTSKLLFKAMNEKIDFNQKKEEREKLQAELEKKTEQLKIQIKEEEQQKISNFIFLQENKNDEKKYQEQLAAKEAQLAALKNFSSTAGGSICLTSSPGSGSDGNFYSQRDPRWCKQYIGNSRDVIGDVGCYLTSISMVYKKIGHNITPSAYAANSSNFWGYTAWANNPNPPNGYSFSCIPVINGACPGGAKGTGINNALNKIDEEMNADRYVIIQIKAVNSSGMHFIVIKSGSNGNYIIHDPWYGADLNFSSHYSTGMIMSLRLFTR